MEDTAWWQKQKMPLARTARLTHMVAEAKKDDPQRSDGAYMQGVTPAGQVGRWARRVPAFGTSCRVKYVYRRFRLGLMDPWVGPNGVPPDAQV